LVKTYVEGLMPGEIALCMMIWTPGSVESAVKSIPDAGKSGADLPAGTGIASVFPVEAAEEIEVST
jgi:hypothetical protein